MKQFTEEFLKSYEEQIRKLPLDELYESEPHKHNERGGVAI